MTERQRIFYFRLWNSLCKEQGWHHLSAVKKDEKRRDLHAKLGLPASSKGFTNAHFSRFKARCEALISGKRDGGEQRMDEDHARRVLIWRIKEDARAADLPESYIESVAGDLTALGQCWEELDLQRLQDLRDTIHNRAGKKVGRDTRTPVRRSAPARAYQLDETRRHEPVSTTADCPF